MIDPLSTICFSLQAFHFSSTLTGWDTGPPDATVHIRFVQGCSRPLFSPLPAPHPGTKGWQQETSGRRGVGECIEEGIRPLFSVNRSLSETSDHPGPIRIRGPFQFVLKSLYLCRLSG